MLPKGLHLIEHHKRRIAFQNIILDHWKILPQSMKKEISKVWSGEDRAIFNRCVLRLDHIYKK
jgi:hypothetical protein